MSARAWRALVGPAALAPLSVAHGLAAAGDAFVAVSLAGSLFFNVSADASRSQVLLYLVVTMVPFAVLAPLVGPTVDRFRRAQRVLAAVCFGVRAVFCLGLAAALFALPFYVFALGLLVASKASGVVKQALVPRLVEDPTQLVPANARLARLAAITGGLGGGVAAAVLELAGAPWVLRSGAVLFAAAVVAALFVRPSAPTDVSPSRLEYAELHAPTVLIGSIGFMAIRAAVGFFVFMLAFTLRRDSEPAWVYGAGAVVYGLGAFVGSLVAPRLRRFYREDRLIAAALVAPAVFTMVGILGVTRALLLVTAASIGLSTTLARHGFDSLLQRNAPDALRGRAFARFETWFQLTWVLGGVVATAITLPAEASMAVLTAIYLPAIALYARAIRDAQRFERESAGTAVGLAFTRLAAAQESHRRNAFRLAIVDAAAAVDMARIAGSRPTGPVDGEDLEVLRRAAVDPDGVVTAGDAARAIDVARQFVTARQLPRPDG